MKSKETIKKLVLKQKTVANLNYMALKNVQGGISIITCINCVTKNFTCPYTCQDCPSFPC